MKSAKIKTISIVGTTASGKTGLAVALALIFDGEVVSADSRQVYKYMDIGSGKDLGEYSVKQEDGTKVEVPHHLIDVVHPNTEYDLAKWLEDAKIAVTDIDKRSKLPIIAGGTGLYTQALIDNYNLSKVPGNKNLRDKLELLSKDELLQNLEGLDRDLVLSLNNSEKNNKRRLIRHIEVLSNIDDGDAKAPPRLESEYESLILGIKWPREILRERIYKRIIDRLENEGMLEEIIFLHEKQDVSWVRLESFGLEYKYLAKHLQGEYSYEEMIEKLHIATCQFAKRQSSWLKRWQKQGTKIHWVKDLKESESIVKSFLKN